MAKNDNLHKAKDAKNDEFYTRIEDVAEELRHYKKHFAGKVVLCNCDDPTWSAFWRYFHLNFAELGLKKLISTHYDRTEPTYKMEYEGGDDNDVEIGVRTPLEGNGDFRSQECLNLLDECDIVVTNPPFSLARTYGNENLLRYDFALLNDDGSVKELLECQGEQHYSPIDEFGGATQFSKQIANDDLKRKYAQEHNIPLHEISYKDKQIDKVYEILYRLNWIK